MEPLQKQISFCHCFSQDFSMSFFHSPLPTTFIFLSLAPTHSQCLRPFPSSLSLLLSLLCSSNFIFSSTCALILKFLNWTPFTLLYSRCCFHKQEIRHYFKLPGKFSSLYDRNIQAKPSNISTLKSQNLALSSALLCWIMFRWRCSNGLLGTM